MITKKKRGDLNVIKELIQHDKEDDYIPLMSAITLTKKRLMLFFRLEFDKTKTDALVDSGAYINAINETDIDKMQKESNASITGKAPPPPFKIQYANTELEKTLATYTMKFKIGDYTFEENFIIMTKTSYLIWGSSENTPQVSTPHKEQSTSRKYNLPWF